jgi:hypothetical protein
MLEFVLLTQDEREYVMVFERKEGSYKEMEKYKWGDEYQREDC